MQHRYAGLGDNGRKLYLYEANRSTKVRQVLWGDWLTLDDGPVEPDGWLRVIWSPNDPAKRRTLFIPESDTAETRPLEIVFVDVGQGDGAVMITPEADASECVIVIDAGEGDNMERFLNGRFRAYRGFDFEAAVITHPDNDHYLGFRRIFDNHRIGFRAVYHNGLVERPVSGKFEKLGALVEDDATGISYCTELAIDTAAVETLFGAPVDVRSYQFPGIMRAALDNPKINHFAMLSTGHGTIEAERAYVPGFAPSDARGYCIEILGPVVEPDAGGAPRLRRIGDYGETKNGHSVLLRLVFGKFSVLFGGDLNEPAERFLLARYAGLAAFPAVESPDYRAMIAKAAERFRSDVMKVCHHGSEKVTDAFLEVVNPACFILSSGDQEGHVHPRPDLLGRLGRFGRGPSPVLLSTELQRSAREREDREVVESLNRSIDALAATPTDSLKAEIKKKIAQLSKVNVDVYGAIYLKTDGKRLITAFKIEAGSDVKRWFYFEYVLTDDGELLLVH